MQRESDKTNGQNVNKSKIKSKEYKDISFFIIKFVGVMLGNNISYTTL